nr:pentatricopeptide repeat-containing protein At1g09900 [Ipomoea trifida]
MVSVGGGELRVFGGNGKPRRNKVFALSRIETIRSNGRVSRVEKGSYGQGENELIMSHNFESNNSLRRLKMPKHGCTPNALSYNPLVHAFCKEKKMDRAIEYLEVMVSRGCYPNIVTYNSLLSGLCKDGKKRERESKSSEEAMERDEEGRFTSCWGRLKVMIPWMRGRRRRANHLLRRQGNNSGVGCGITTSILTTTSDKSKTAGIFRYSPLSYAQNFDHGCPLEDDEDSAPLRFSTRYAAAASSTKSSQGR